MFFLCSAPPSPPASLFSDLFCVTDSPAMSICQPCSVYLPLSLLWTLLDASDSSLSHSYNKTLPLDHTMSGNVLSLYTEYLLNSGNHHYIN